MKLTHRLAWRLASAWWSLRRPVTVGALVMLVRDEEILLVRTTYKRSWFLPGGRVKRGETLEQAARREAREEVGASLGELSLWGIYSSFKHGKSDHACVFLCRDFTLTGESDHEIEELRWFPLDALPADASPGTWRRLEELRRGRAPGHGPW